MKSTVLLLLGAGLASAGSLKTSTPILGWNSYNKYGCNPTQTIIQTNAKGLVTLGLSNLGYVYVTPDCGWNSPGRDSSGQLIWNKSNFPAGGAALGSYIHGLGLKFGVYSGGGYYQCGSTNQPASLGHETTDAASFAAWGADALKYDNCYSTGPSTNVDYGPTSGTPDRYQAMASALAATNRSIAFQICQWGLNNDLGSWASKTGDSWRVSNDIQDNWASIWRITNEVIPYWRWTAPGAYPDMDMLIVGLNVLSQNEEQFHFGMWAIHKSPLVMGCPTDGSTNAASIKTLSNTEVIAINQDSLGAQARLVRRYTEEQYDIYVGNLSDSRLVVGLANWGSSSQSISLNVSDVLGVASASARDVWAKTNATISNTYTATLGGHQLQILVLSNIVRANGSTTSTGYHSAASASLSGGAAVTSCSTSQCLPVTKKVTKLGTVAFTGITTARAGKHVVGVDFCNYDIATSSAWSGGTNTRNMTIQVNSGAQKRWAFPISGGNWFETGRLNVELDGFVVGSNTVTFRASSGSPPDLVGFEIFE